MSSICCGGTFLESCGVEVEDAPASPIPELRKDRKRRQYAERIAAGLCGRCGKERESVDRYCCNSCLDKATKRRRKLTEAGRCLWCTEPKDGDKLLCVKCGEVNNTKSKEYRDQYRDDVYSHYGYKCACCGEANPLFLQIDHVNNDGYKDHREGKVGITLYRKIVSEGFPDSYQILCANCNWGKRCNGGVCPHVTERQRVELIWPTL